MSIGTTTSVILLLSLAPAVSAQCELKTILPPGQVIEGIGRSVDAADQGVILGSYKDDRKGHDAGSMTPFQKNGTSWRHEKTMNASDPEPDAWFGFSVARTEDMIVSSAPNRSAPGLAQAGALYVFRGDPVGWILDDFHEEAKLVPADITAGAKLGWDVDIEGVTGGVELIAAGAPFHAHEGGPAGGAVYLYRTVTPGVWTLEAELVGGVEGAEFGTSVALSKGTLAVGAPGANGGVGEVHIFQQVVGVWTEVAVIPSASATADRFGEVVDIRMDVADVEGVLAVGAPKSDAAGPVDSGLAATYDLSLPAWASLGDTVAPEPQANAHFGGAVSLSPFITMLAVGAPEGVTATGVTGRVWLFDEPAVPGPWPMTDEMPLTKPKDGGGFGTAVSLWDDFVLVGAPIEVPDLIATGAVHAIGGLFEKWVDLGFGKPGPTYTPVLTATGVLCPQEVLGFDVTGGPPKVAGELIVGLSVGNTPYKGGILVPVQAQVISAHVGTNSVGSLHVNFKYPGGSTHGLNFVAQVWLVDATATQGWISTNGVMTFDP
jgi:FG-GAP repeat